MKTKLVLIIGLLSMQPLFGRGLNPQEKSDLQTASTAAALTTAINTAVAANSVKPDDQNLIAAAKNRLAAMGAQPAPAPAPTQTTQPTQTRGTVAANIMAMPEFAAAQQAALQVKTAIAAQPGATPNDVTTVMQAITR